MKLILLLLVTCSSAFAQIPSKQFVLGFTNVPLWDISGDYQRFANFSTVTGTLVLHADGKITGTRTEIYDHNGDHMEGSAFISGLLVGKPAGIQFRDQWQGTYSGMAGGRGVVVNVKAKGTGVLVPSSHSIQASATAKLCVLGGKCTTSTDGYELPLAPSMDGTWSLDLDLVNDGKNINGTAALILSTGRTLDYQVSGVTNAARASAVLHLKGINEASRTSLLLSTHGDELALTKIFGKVLGQIIKTQ
jgi:hypothetical protein